MNLPRPRRRRVLCSLIAAAVATLTPAVAAPVLADEALVAVATNFAEVIQELEVKFESATHHRVTFTTGSTGRLYSQIVTGAPFDVLLAANQLHPQRLETGGDAVAGSRFTYAVGHLTLWSPDAGRVAENGVETLSSGDFRVLAMANPDLAPYGAAARQTLVALGLFDGLRERIVRGQNIGQAYSMVATGNAELGFVALSHVLSPRNRKPGSRWDVPADLHAPIRQDAVLLARAAKNLAAQAFLDFLGRQEARVTIARYGYGVE